VLRKIEGASAGGAVVDQQRTGPALAVMALVTVTLLLALLLPFTVEVDAQTTAVPMVLYALFISSLGATLGITVTWWRLAPNASPTPHALSGASPEAQPSDGEVLVQVHQALLAEDERVVVDLMLSFDGIMAQAAIAEATGFTSSKVSRLLSRMEERSLVERVRDGMGKRVRLLEGIH
jgi:hypothetical protein